MPQHLQIELAKNNDIEFRSPVQIGEDVYMFRLQTAEIIDVLETENPGVPHDQIMNIWHANRLRHNHTIDHKQKGTSSKSKLKTETLAGSPMCVEMMLSCGQGGAVFNALLNNTNIQHLTSENGGLALATLWLDMYTLNKVSFLSQQLNSNSFVIDLQFQNIG
jgi:hypothetical protein